MYVYIYHIRYNELSVFKIIFLEQSKLLNVIISGKKLAKNLKIFIYTIICEVIFSNQALTVKVRVSNIVYTFNKFIYIIKNKF